MLQRDRSGLMVIDVQGRLARVVENSETVILNIGNAIRGARILGLPILWLEQTPAKMGGTVPELAELLEGNSPLAKTCFGACGSESVVQQIAKSRRDQWLLCGIEAHICVYQTAMGLLDKGMEVEVLVDCVSSRSISNRELALTKMQSKGVGLSSVEMCLYELLGDSAYPEFRELLKVVK